MMAPSRTLRRPRYSIRVGRVELILDGPTEDWRLECSKCGWSSSARGVTEAQEWAHGHDVTHRRLRRWWDGARGSWLRW